MPLFLTILLFNKNFFSEECRKHEIIVYVNVNLVLQ